MGLRLLTLTASVGSVLALKWTEYSDADCTTEMRWIEDAGDSFFDESGGLGDTVECRDEGHFDWRLKRACKLDIGEVIYFLKLFNKDDTSCAAEGFDWTDPDTGTAYKLQKGHQAVVDGQCNRAYNVRTDAEGLNPVEVPLDVWYKSDSTPTECTKEESESEEGPGCKEPLGPIVCTEAGFTKFTTVGTYEEADSQDGGAMQTKNCKDTHDYLSKPGGPSCAEIKGHCITGKNCGHLKPCCVADDTSAGPGIVAFASLAVGLATLVGGYKLLF